MALCKITYDVQPLPPPPPPPPICPIGRNKRHTFLNYITKTKNEETFK